MQMMAGLVGAIGLGQPRPTDLNSDLLKKACASEILMSALTPKADVCSALGDVRFVPIADIATLFDDLISGGE